MTFRFALFSLSSILISISSFSQERMTTDDYFIEIPNHWNSFDDEYLGSFENDLVNKFESRDLNGIRSYVIGYCENKWRDEIPPFFLGVFTSINDYNTVKFDTIVATTTRIWMVYDSLITPIEDRENDRFHFELELGGMYLFLGYVPGATGMLNVTFYSELNQVDDRRKQFLQIYQSVEHKRPYVYHNAKEAVEKEMKRTGYFLGVAILLFSIVSVARYYMKKMRAAADEPFE